MPPKKQAPGPDGTTPALLKGFADRETKLLAAAFVSSIGPDKYDYDLMSTLTDNTAGSLKKMWPPVKKKAMENHATFAALLHGSLTAAAGGDKANPKANPKAAAIKKRKAPDADTDESAEQVQAKPALKKKAVPAKPRTMKAKTEEVVAESSEEDEELKLEPKKKTATANGQNNKKVKTEETSVDEDGEVTKGTKATTARRAKSESSKSEPKKKPGPKGNKKVKKEDDIEEAEEAESDDNIMVKPRAKSADDNDVDDEVDEEVDG